MSQCVAVCCSVLQCVTVCCSVLQCVCVAVCCSVSQCDAMCCSVSQCDAVCCNVSQCDAVCCSVMQCVTVCCSVLQYWVSSDKSALCRVALECEPVDILKSHLATQSTIDNKCKADVLRISAACSRAKGAGARRTNGACGRADRHII